MIVEMLKFSGPILVAHGVVFGALVLGIRRLLLQTALKAVRGVQQAESEVRKKEGAILRQIEEHDKEFARRQAEAEETLERRRRQSEADVNQMRDKLIEEAKLESRRIIERARQNEENMRQQLVLEMEGLAMNQAGQMLDMVLSEAVIGALHRCLIEELFDALDEMDTEGITVEADAVTVRSSQALADDHRERLHAILKNKFNAETRIETVVDPELMGGLALKLGSLEIDGSLRNRLREAQAEISKNAKR